jgi:hypothetical protein
VRAAYTGHPGRPKRHAAHPRSVPFQNMCGRLAKAGRNASGMCRLREVDGATRRVVEHEWLKNVPPEERAHWLKMDAGLVGAFETVRSAPMSDAQRSYWLRRLASLGLRLRELANQRYCSTKSLELLRDDLLLLWGEWQASQRAQPETPGPTRDPLAQPVRSVARAVGRGLRGTLGVLLLVAGSFVGRIVVRGIIAGEIATARSHHPAPSAR